MRINRRMVFALLGSGVASSTAAQRAPRPPAFNHGVASGDPLQDRVLIWTRLNAHLAGRSLQW